MNRTLIAALLSVAFAASAAEPQARPSVPKVNVAVKPAGDDTFLVTSTFTEYGTGKVVANPSMVIKAGTWGTVEISGAPDKSATRLSATVAPNGKGAAYFAESILPSGVIDTQSGTIVLAN